VRGKKRVATAKPRTAQKILWRVRTDQSEDMTQELAFRQVPERISDELIMADQALQKLGSQEESDVPG
jgi:hypothetical protein